MTRMTDILDGFFAVIDRWAVSIMAATAADIEAKNANR